MPKRSAYDQLVELERRGLLTPADKIILSAWRQKFPKRKKVGGTLMRKRKPIGIKRASKLMHDVGLRTPEDIRRQFEMGRRLAAYEKLGQSIGGDKMCVTVASVDIERIDTQGTRCGACHLPISPGLGVAFGRPQFTMPAINVCQTCVAIALTLIQTSPVIIDVEPVSLCTTCHHTYRNHKDGYHNLHAKGCLVMDCSCNAFTGKEG